MIQLPFHQFRTLRGYTSMNCKTCSKETSNPSYCSRSCSAKSTNRSHPKRKPEGNCRDCGTVVPSSLAYCPGCRKLREMSVDKSKNSNKGNNPSCRTHARKVYAGSQRPLACCLCGYDKHVDICHIRDIRDYPDGTLFSVINISENLLAMCKNHHWEFDHGML
jgi:HNH endonuclease